MKILILLVSTDLGVLDIKADDAAMVSIVISLVVLIVFFYMAVNISKIKRSLNPANSTACFDLAEKYEFMRENKKALEMYLEGVYLEAKGYIGDQDQINSREKGLRVEFEDKIKELGGEWPNFKTLKF